MLSSPRKIAGMTVALFALCVAAPARASLITGGIAFGGAANPSGASSWATATGVDFGNSSPNASVFAVSGDYSGVPTFTTATFSDFTFSPSLSPSPVAPLWAFTWNQIAYSFNLASVIVVGQGIDQLGNSFLNLAGQGTLYATGFDPTPGVWSFSGQDTRGNFSFSASNAAVPEPGSMILLGTGLMSLGYAVRRRRQKSRG